MALKTYKPTTPSQRELVLIDRADLWKGKPLKSLTEGMGGVGIEVSKPEELGPAILKARQLNAEGRTVLIDVKSNFESRKSFQGV